MKIKPYIFLSILFVILLFIIGVRYGQKVEQTNKTINYYLSLPPTKPPVKTIPISYVTYKSTGCGISFLYPNDLIIKEKPDAVYFTDKNKADMLKIDCLPLNIQVNFNAPNTTAEATFKKKNIAVKIYKKNNQETYLFYLNDFIKNKQIICQVDKSLFPLFEKTLEFISPTP